MPSRATRVVLLLAALASAGCGASTAHLAVSHRHSPDSEARVVVLPVKVPATVAEPEATGRTLATLYSTELLRSYDVLDYERFRRSLSARGITVDSLLAGAPDVAAELRVDGVLQSEVYRWQPGTPGFWFLAKKGQVGFHAHLVDLRTGSVIWSVNRARETGPKDTLPIALATVFEELSAEMPSPLTPY
jgi:hypothetical protein